MLRGRSTVTDTRAGVGWTRRESSMPARHSPTAQTPEIPIAPIEDVIHSIYLHCVN